MLGVVRLSEPGCSALLMGTSPCVTSSPLQPQPARVIGSLDSSYLVFCSRGVGLRSAAKIKPVTRHGHSKALGSFPVWNKQRGGSRLQLLPKKRGSGLLDLTAPRSWGSLARRPLLGAEELGGFV